VGAGVTHPYGVDAFNTYLNRPDWPDYTKEEKMGNGTSPGTVPADQTETVANSRIYGFTGYEFEINDIKYTVRRCKGETVIIKTGEPMKGSGSPDRVLTVKDEHLPALVTALQGVMK
jgi:hypothetical protein